MSAKWRFDAAYSSELIGEQSMSAMVDRMNATSVRYEWRYRRGNGTTDWIVEYRRKGC